MHAPESITMNQSYPKGDQKFGAGSINWTGDTIEVLRLTSAYTFSLTHEFESDLTGIIDRATLAGKTNTDGILDGDNIAFGAPASDVAALVVLKQTGNPATAPLLLFFDSAAGLPYAAAGRGMTWVWPDAANYKIYRIGGQRS